MLHSSALHPAVVAIDGLVAATALSATGVSPAATAGATAAFLIAAVLGRLHARRNVLETQGLGWYLRLLPFPLLAVAGALTIHGQLTARQLVVAVAATAVVLVVLRAIAWSLVARRRRQRRGLRQALLIGTSARTAQVTRRIEAYPEAGLAVAATYAPASTNGERSRARALLESGSIAHVLVAAEAHDDALLDECARWSAGSAVEFGIVLPVGTATPGLARIGDLGVVVLGNRGAHRRRFWAKRVVDVALSALLLVLLAPVFAIVSLAVFLYDRGPVFYRQRRVGLNNREFMIWKFRSMVPGADELNERYAHANVANGLLFKLPDDPRVTPVGNMIRRLSIDELPQLVNVLFGDMSLVGPRPLPVDPDEFDDVAAERHRVRPGITGPWQVAGGHVVGYEDMIKLDLAYVESWSLRRDFWLLLMTIPTVLVRRSAY
jgi:exopolysaccharide biosynthesis polyprenyl glycosylphosphotransferase